MPGTATKDDLLALGESPQKRQCELIDGVLVEKVMGMYKSLLAALLIQTLSNFLQENDLGLVSGPDGPVRVLPGQVRLPDACVFLWESIPSHAFPTDKICPLTPDLVVEIVSEGNTRQEITRKLKEYFVAGVRQVWTIYPKNQSARVYSAPDKYRRVARNQSLTGGDVLPGFILPLSNLFTRLAGPRTRKR